MGKIVVMDHPLIQHKIGYIRRKDTGTKDFRQTISEIAMLICYEATRNLQLSEVQIETPICTAKVKELKGKKMAIVPILRAGLGMVDGVLQLIPTAKIGHIGLYRDPQTLEPVDKGCKNIHFMCILAAPEGVERMEKAHPDVDVYIGALDEKLNEHGYIVPGLGDAGDRIFGTK